MLFGFIKKIYNLDKSARIYNFTNFCYEFSILENATEELRGEDVGYNTLAKIE